MAFIVASVIGAGAALAGGAIAAKGARDAGKTAAAGSDRQIEYNRESRDIALDLQSPYREAGYSALDKLGGMTGLLESGGSFGRPDFQGSGQALSAEGSPWGDSPWSLKWGDGGYQATLPDGTTKYWDDAGQQWMDSRSSAYGSNPSPQGAKPVWKQGGDAGDWVQGRAGGGALYNVNELGPESVHSQGSFTRSAMPTTLPPDPTGYVQPQIRGRYMGGAMYGGAAIMPNIIGDYVAQQRRTAPAIQGSQPTRSAQDYANAATSFQRIQAQRPQGGGLTGGAGTNLNFGGFGQPLGGGYHPPMVSGGQGARYDPSAGNYSNNVPGSLGGPPRSGGGLTLSQEGIDYYRDRGLEPPASQMPQGVDKNGEFGWRNGVPGQTQPGAVNDMPVGTTYIDNRTGRPVEPWRRNMIDAGNLNPTTAVSSNGQPAYTTQTTGGAYPTPQENPYDFTTDPGYNFRFNEGMRALEGSAAARGGLLSGGFGRKAIRYGQDYASAEFSNIYNRISNIAGLGQVSAQSGGNAALMGGQQMGGAAATGAVNSAYGQMGETNAWANAANQIAQLPWDQIKWGGNKYALEDQG